jgi:fibronectin type 3 domain-containing protein
MSARLGPHRLIGICACTLFALTLACCLQCGAGQHNQAIPKQHSVNLSWNPSSTSNVEYNIYRGTQHLGPYPEKVNPAPLSSTSFTDSTVQNGKTYYYVVTAVDQNSVESDYSNEAQIIVPSS